MQSHSRWLIVFALMLASCDPVDPLPAAPPPISAPPRPTKHIGGNITRTGVDSLYGVVCYTRGLDGVLSCVKAF